MIEPRPVISTEGLVKRFRDVDAVAGIDLRVPAGGIYGFLGPNGAGKTTTIRILLGLLRPTRGVASLFGEPVAPGRKVLDRVGALVERPAFYPYLTATTLEPALSGLLFLSDVQGPSTRHRVRCS